MESSLNLSVIVFDGILALGLLVLAWALLRSPDLFKAIVLFISFGLIMSLAWVRLKAVDIALAEAAIGAGLTGALFLSALSRMHRDSRRNDSQEYSRPSPEKKMAVDRIVTKKQMQNRNKMVRMMRSNQTTQWQKAITGIGALAVTLIIGWTVWTLPPFSDRMHNLVADKLSISGVENPVTAVLLNFRGYDTLLEIAVLLLTAVSVLSTSTLPGTAAEPPPSSIQTLLLRQLLPFIILVGGYILWIGKYAPGGAFQAGAVLAAGGVLLMTSAVQLNPLTIKLLPIGLSIGLLTFLAVALAAMMAGGNLLQYPLAWAGTLILLIEAAATVSIAVILTILFVGRQPAGGD